jgi:hypothetical protein
MIAKFSRCSNGSPESAAQGGSGMVGNMDTEHYGLSIDEILSLLVSRSR